MSCLRAASRLTSSVSAAGKTQFMLTLLLSVQLGSSIGKDGKPCPKSALYISTEAPLQTTRLAQILREHPQLASLPDDKRPSLSRIHSTHIHDLEAQDHILNFQVPAAIEKHNVGLVIVDSIAANYRAEFDRGEKSKKGSGSLAQRSGEIAQTSARLRNIARDYNVAVVLANQVADRFTTAEPTSQRARWSQTVHPGAPSTQTPTMPAPGPSQAPPHPSQNAAATLSTDDPLSLDHQQNFFTGWGDDPTVTDLKTPSLGLTLTNALSTRIALLKEPIYKERAYLPGEERELAGWKRTFKVVFSAWCAASKTPFEIWEGGVRTIDAVKEPVQEEATATDKTLEK